MKYLAHRGYWLKPEEKNSALAFERAFRLGFGIETDIRDCNGKLLIAHDLPCGNEMLFSDFLTLYKKFPHAPMLGLNIKADGLQALLKKALAQFDVSNYFVFDMSVPDGLAFLKHGLASFTRQSEYESEPLPFYKEASGVWVDCFLQDWIDEQTIWAHLQQNKKVALVSPELHKREHLTTWQRYKKMACIDNPDVYLCTDLPEAAQRFFA